MNKQIILTIILLSMYTLVSAQTGMKQIDPSVTFNKRLAEEAVRLQSIESDFTQVKYLDVFDEKVISKGRFYFKKENKICLDYTSPLNYLMVINGEKLKIISEGKTSLVNLGSNPMMNEMKAMLSACMIGDLSQLTSGYQVDYFENAMLYKVNIWPVSQAIKAYLREIVICIDKKSMLVKNLRLSESEKDYTEYEFTNQKYNTLTSDEKFSVR